MMCLVLCNKTFELHLEIEAGSSWAWACCQPCLLQWGLRERDVASAWPWPCFPTLYYHLFCPLLLRWEEEGHSYCCERLLLWAWGVFKVETCASGTSFMSFQRPAPCPSTPSTSLVLLPPIPLLWMMHSLWPLITCLLSSGSQGLPLLTQGEAESPTISLHGWWKSAHHQLLKVVLYLPALS